MKKSFFASILILVLFLVGCGTASMTDTNNDGNGGSGSGGKTELPSFVMDAIDVPKSKLSQNVKDAITYMYSEEGLAHDVYLNIYKIQAVKQLQNIATKSEVKHIEAVNQLAIKYDLNMTQYPDTDVPYSIDGIKSGMYPVESVQDLYNMLYDKGIQSKQAALEVGCMVEVVDINDLDDYIEEAEKSNAPDVLEVFKYLRNGSYNHYWSFDAGLENMNITDGCCSLGQGYCHPEYPSK